MRFFRKDAAMMRWTVLLLGFVLLAGPGAALARGGQQGHGGHGGQATAGVHARPTGVHARPIFVHSRPVVAHSRPAAVHHHHHHHRPFVRHRTVVVGTAVVVAGAAYPYYAYPPAYVEQPVTYIEQPTSEPPAGQVLYYCPDSREYYPNVPTCPSPWLKVVP